MKGSDRQAAKAWAINIAIQRTEKPERFDRETPLGSDSHNSRILFDRRGGASRLDLGGEADGSSRFST